MILGRSARGQRANPASRLADQVVPCIKDLRLSLSDSRQHSTAEPSKGRFSAEALIREIGRAYAGATSCARRRTGAYWLRRLDCNQGLSGWPTVMAEGGKVPDANRGRRARRPVKLPTRLPRTG